MIRSGIADDPVALGDKHEVAASIRDVARAHRRQDRIVGGAAPAERIRPVHARDPGNATERAVHSVPRAAGVRTQPVVQTRRQIDGGSRYRLHRAVRPSEIESA